MLDSVKASFPIGTHTRLLISLGDIFCLMTTKTHKILVYHEGGICEIDGTLSFYAEHLKRHGFCRINRFVLVSLQHVIKFSQEQVQIDDSDASRFKISEKYAGELDKMLEASGLLTF